LGLSAHDSVPRAKARAESVYHGVASRWIDANVTEQMAEEYLKQMFGDVQCCVCGRRPHEVNSLTQGDSGFICERCAG
jgi:hypothetical protein